MKMPKAAPGSIALFQSLVPQLPEVEQRKMFGQPAAFFSGHLFLGVFGDQVFLRLNDGDRQQASKLPGVTPFAPMAGRVMKDYLVFPGDLLADARRARPWVERAVSAVRSLPPKGRTVTSKRR